MIGFNQLQLNSPLQISQPNSYLAAKPPVGGVALPPRSGTVPLPPVHHATIGAAGSVAGTATRQRREQQLGRRPTEGRYPRENRKVDLVGMITYWMAGISGQD